VRPRVLYVAGTGRSGSTLLATLLSRQPAFLGVGELRYVWERSLGQNQLCGCGEPFRRCRFWTDVFADAFGGFDRAEEMDVPTLASSIDRVRHVPALALPHLRSHHFGEGLRAYAEILTRLYRSIVAVAGGGTVVDSSKDPSYAYVLATVDDLELSLVHLLRDSRAVAYSWTRKRVRPEIHWEVQYMNTRPPLKSALLWDQHNALLEVLGRRHPRSLRMRYEDLVADPDSSLQRVGALSGESVAAVDGALEGTRFPHSVSGNPMRFDRGPLTLRPDTEWKDKMPTRQRRLVTAASAPLLARYGYLRPRRAPTSRP